jgi:uncharacterized protein YjbJ (UPF0337 family)
MDSSTQDKTSGTADQIKGKAQEAWGDITGDEDTQAQGQANQAKGNVEKGVGDLKDAANDFTGNS